MSKASTADWKKRLGSVPAPAADSPAPPVAAPRGSTPPRFSTYLDAELRRRLKIHAATVGRPVWEVVRDALTAYLDAPRQ